MAFLRRLRPWRSSDSSNGANKAVVPLAAPDVLVGNHLGDLGAWGAIADCRCFRFAEVFVGGLAGLRRLLLPAAAAFVFVVAVAPRRFLPRLV